MLRIAVLRLQCNCGELLELSFDTHARQHWKTVQCPECRTVAEVMRPTVIELPSCSVSVPKPDSERAG